MRTLLSLLSALALGVFVSETAFAQTPSDSGSPVAADSDNAEPSPPQPTAPLTLPLIPQAAPPTEAAAPLDPPVLPAVPPQQLPPPQLTIGPKMVQASMWGSALGEPMKTTRRWYGWQTLAILGPVDFLSILGFAGNVPELQVFAIYALAPTHALAGPIVHWAHGNTARGFASLGLNVGLPAAGILPGIFVALSAKGGEGIVAMMALGGLAAHVIDLSLWSYDDVKEPVFGPRPKSASALQPSSVALMPMMDAERRGLMLVGQF